jgi:hypothetical protein
VARRECTQQMHAEPKDDVGETERAGITLHDGMIHRRRVQGLARVLVRLFLTGRNSGPCRLPACPEAFRYAVINRCARTCPSR